MPGRAALTAKLTAGASVLALGAGVLVGVSGGVVTRAAQAAGSPPPSSAAAILSRITPPAWMTGPIKSIASVDDSMYVISDDTLVALNPATGSWGSPLGISYIPRQGQQAVDDTLVGLTVSDDTIYVGLTEGLPLAFEFAQFQGINRVEFSSSPSSVAVAKVADVACNNSGTAFGVFAGAMSARSDGRLGFGTSQVTKCGTRFILGWVPRQPVAEANLGTSGSVGGVAFRDDTMYVTSTGDGRLYIAETLSTGSGFDGNPPHVSVLSNPGPVAVTADDTVAVASTTGGAVQLLHSSTNYTATNWTTPNASGTGALAFDSRAVLYAAGTHVAIKGFGATSVDDSVSLNGSLMGNNIAVWNRQAGSVALVPYTSSGARSVARVGIAQGALGDTTAAVGGTVKVTVTGPSGVPVDDSVVVSASFDDSAAVITANRSLAGGGRQFDITVPAGSGTANVVLALRGGNRINAGLFTYPATATYTITYDAQGGSVSPTSASVTAGQSLTLPTPTYSGYTFNGWFTQSTGGTQVTSPYTPAASGTIYAQWTAVPNPNPNPNPPQPTPTPSPSPTEPPAPEPVPPLAPGDAYLTVDGAPQPVTVEPNTQSDGVTIAGSEFDMELQGLDRQGEPLNLSADGVLILNTERQVEASGTGFKPDFEIDLYMNPPTTQTTRAARATEPVYVGTVKTDAAGDFSGLAQLPPDIDVGDHVVQAVGYTKTGATRAVSLGVRVEPEFSAVLDKGTRTVDGRYDRISTSGTTTGLKPGSRLTAWIRYSGQTTFTKANAKIVVQADGTFRWTRLVRPDRAVTAYVAKGPDRSNTVTWRRIR